MRVRSRLGDSLTRELRHHAPGPAGLLGLEVEYRVLENGAQIDFARVIAELAAASPVPLRQERRTGYRFPCGHLLLCDGLEAEIATPPERLAADAPTRLAVSLFDKQNFLLALLRERTRRTGRTYLLRGVSCHFNVQAAATDSLARAILLRHGPLLQLLTCLPSTLSVVCRPRQGRLEFVTDYVGDLERMRACITVIVAAVQQASGGELEQMQLPRLRAETLSRYPIRCGWQLDVEAAGRGLRSLRRHGIVERVEAIPMPLQAWIERCWQELRPHAERSLARDEIALADDYVGGKRLGGLEIDHPDAANAETIVLPVTTRERTPFAAMLAATALGDWSLSAVFVHWSFVALQCRRADHEAILVLPDEYWPQFIAGEWNALISASLDDFASSPANERQVFSHRAQAMAPGIFHEIDAIAIATSLEQVANERKKKPRTKKCHVDVKLWRLGHYPGELAEHLRRPFYRRRTLEEQEGADLFMFPVDRPDLGKRQRFYVSIAPELALDQGLTIRVYTSRDLSTYTDYSGPPSVNISAATPNIAYVDVQSPKTIYFIHIIHIRYAGLLSLPGHAVEINVTILPEDSESDICSHLWVNLLLYEHDLGDAESGASAVPLPGSDLFAANIGNGNLHLHVPLFEWEGRGMSLECDLYYNSFHAAQMEAVARMGRINHVPPEELEEEYARNTVGTGWSYTYGTNIVDYVLSEGGTNIRKRLELIAPDGNHIQFEASPDPLGARFVPIGRGTLWLSDPQVGGSLIILASSLGYELTDLYGQRLRFDLRGRVTEIATPAAARSGGALAPIRVEYSDASVVITDTVGRQLVAATHGWRVANFRDPMQRTWRLEPGTSPQWLGKLHWPHDPNHLDHHHSFDYDRWYFLRRLENRRGYTATTHHVEAGPAWGRVDGVARMTLEWSIVYEPPSAAERSVATAKDTRATDYRYTWDRDSLALYELRARRPAQKTPIVDLPESWILVKQREYYTEPLGTGKLPVSTRDLHGFHREMRYKPTPDGRGFFLERGLIDGRTLYRYTLEAATNRIHEQFDNNNRVTTFTYDAYANQHTITFPLLMGKTTPAVETNVFTSDGRLESHTDRAGVKTTYGFGGPGDPYGLGLMTSKTVGGVTWRYSYHLSGRVHEITDGMFGGVTQHTYDVLDREYQVSNPPGTVIDDGDLATAHAAGLVTKSEFDPNGNLDHIDVPLGGNESFGYDEHDRRIWHTDPDGTMTYDEFDGSTEVVKLTDRRSFSWIKHRDYLGRERRLEAPKSGGGQLVETIVHPQDGAADIELYVSSRSDRDYPRHRAVVQRGWHGEILIRARWVEVDENNRSPVALWQYGRDRYGHARDLWFSVDGVVKYHEHYDLDEWYRVKAVTVANATTTYALGDSDEVLSITTPDHGGGAPAMWQFKYDDLLRETTIIDPYLTTTNETNYFPATSSAPARVEYHAIPLDALTNTPEKHRSAPSTLAMQKAVTFDARGLPVIEQRPGFPDVELFYDVRQRLTATRAAAELTTYKLDGHGRRIHTRVRDRVQDITTVQRYDEHGNQTFQSGKHVNMRFGYSALNQLSIEWRTPEGESEVTFRTLDYDEFGRLVKRVADGYTTVLVPDDIGNAVSWTASGNGDPVRGRVSYWWSGHVRSYSRTIANGQAYSYSTEQPDALGRITKIRSSYSRLIGEVELDHYPAGTRRSLTVRWWPSGTSGDTDPVEQVGTRTYAYYPNWQLRSIDVPGQGSWDLSYQPSGALTAWKSPRGHVHIVGQEATGAMRSGESRRVDGTRFLSFETRYEQAGADIGLESTSTVTHVHGANELPSSGSTTYSSRTTYARGLPTQVDRSRTGLGESVRRSLVNHYKGDGTLTSTDEDHTFPNAPGGNYQVTHTYVETPTSFTISSEPKTNEPAIRSLQSGTQRFARDRYGRTLGLTTETFLDPGGVAGWFINVATWTQGKLGLRRDELGRVYRTHCSQATREPSEVKWKPLDLDTRTTIFHGPVNEVAARRITVRFPIEVGQPPYPHAERYTERLYLYDGTDVVAEIGRDFAETKPFEHSSLLRFYELGPGRELRLAVLHRRSYGGQRSTRYDEYGYGPGLRPLVLIGEPDDGSAGFAVVRRFAMWDMPLPGADREEQVRPGDAENAQLVSAGSPLSGQAVVAVGGVPPQLADRQTLAIGSTVTTRAHDETFAGLVMPSALLENVQDTEPDLVDPSELPDLPDTSFRAKVEQWIEYAIDHVPIVNWTYRLNKSKAWIKEGRWDLAKGDVEKAIQEIQDAITAVIPTESVLMDIWSAYQIARDPKAFLHGLLDPLTVLGGRDPNTGEALTFAQRFGLPPLPSLSFGSVRPVVSSSLGCFPASTPVWTPSGARAIETLSAGDVVDGWCDGRIAPCRVLDVHGHVADTVIVDLGSVAFEVTNTQPVLVDGRGWIAVGDLRAGDRLVDADGHTLPIVGIGPGGVARPVFNLSVEHAHTYLIDERRIVVHNKPTLTDNALKIRWAHLEATTVTPAYWMAKWLDDRGEPEAFWRLDALFRNRTTGIKGHFIRGNVGEYVLFKKRYRDQGFAHVGKLFNGTFEWDFHLHKRHVSLKTVQVSGGPRAYHNAIVKNLHLAAEKKRLPMGRAKRELHCVLPYKTAVEDPRSLYKLARELRVKLRIVRLPLRL